MLPSQIPASAIWKPRPFWIVFCFNFLSCMLCNALLQAQSVISLTVDDGLSQGYVASVACDEDGFTWMSTLNGLNRYDGFSFQTWFEHGSGLKSNFVVNVKSDRRGFLWICTTRGLQIMDRKTGIIVSLDCLRNEQEKYGQTFFVDGQGRGWLAFGKELVCIMLPHHWTSVYDLAKSASATPVTIPAELGKINSISSYDQDLLINTEKGIFEFRTQEKRFTFLEGLPKKNVHMSWYDPVQKQLLARYDHELILKKGDYIRSWLLEPAVWMHEYNLIHDWDKTYVLSKYKVYEWKDSTLVPLPHRIDAEIVSGTVDMYGKVWLGTNAKGARIVKPWQQVFSILLPGTSIGGMLYDQSKNRFWFPEPGDYPVSTYFLVDREKNRFGRILTKTPYQTLCFLPNGDCWGISLTNKLEKTGENGVPVAGTEFQLPTGFFKGVTKSLAWLEETRKLAITDYFGRVILFDPVTQKVQFRKFDHLLNGTSGEPKAIVDDRYGNVWMAIAVGLVQISDSGTRIITTSGQRGKTLSSEKVNDVYVDPSDTSILWVGTAQGLDKVHIQTGDIEWYTREDGLNDDFIYTILAGKEGDLWLGTNRGLLCFNRLTKQVVQYTVADGLPASEFNTGMAWTAKDSTLYFGTVGGLIHFNPYKMPVHQTSPDIRITGIEINGRALKPDSAAHEQLVPYLTTLTLQPDQNNLAVRFTVMDFFNSEKYNCRYRLDDADNDWHYTWSNNMITYSSLHAGTYNFRVAASDGAGGWGEERTLQIVVLPPWWNRWWAWIIWVYLAAKGIWITMMLRKRWTKMSRQMEMDRLEARYRKELEENKTRMFVNIAHEVRTPLTIMLGLTEEISEAAGPALKGRAGLMQQSGRQLLNVVQQILDLTKLEEHRLELNPHFGDMSAFVRYVAEPFETIFRSRDIEFILHLPELPVMMSFDPQYVQPVISNLLSNALKFTAKGGIITLEMKEEAGNRIVLSVEDTGIGIAQEHLLKIFDRYYQVEGAYEASGTGIGLTYVNELVKAMGGEITVNSVVGVGSVFTIYLPALNGGPKTPEWKPEQHLPASANAASAPGTGKSRTKPLVLVVEDNYEMAQFILRALTGEFEVQHAINGTEGLESALALVPDLIVTDVMMPEMNGFDFCAAIKTNPVTDHIPVIMLTARAEDADRIQGLRLGADLYLTKPFNREVLRLHLRNMIALRKRLHARLQQESPEAAAGRAGDTPEEVFAKSIYETLARHYSEPEFGVDELGRQFGMSTSQFHRKVSALLGHAPGEVMRKYRLEQARNMLLHSRHLSISEIAYSAGFRDPNYFSQTFSRAYGKSPSQFRQQQEKGPI